MNIGKFKIELSDGVKQEADIIKKTAMVTFSLCVLFILVIGGTFFILVSFWGPLKPAQAQIHSIGMSAMYVIEGFALDDDLSDFIVDYCGKENSSYNKTLCVQDFMKSNFNYKKHDELLKSLGSVAESGGVCRDYANNFCRITNRMGINCYLVPVNEHVFSVVEFVDFNETQDTSSIKRCVIDQGKSFCW